MNLDNHKNKIVYPELSYTITGVCFKVHNTLGRFSREKQYGDALEELLKDEKIQYQRECVVGNTGNRVDFVVEDKIVLELKAKDTITREDYYQIQRYLQAMEMKLGLLINFRSKYLKPTRVIKIDTDARTKFV